jgi:transposase-like protein
MKKPVTLTQAIAYFADTERAFDYAKFLRWPDDKVTCPRCSSDSNSFVKTRRLWFCNGCKKQFTVKVGTIFEDSPMGLDKWMAAVWMICNCKNGISSHELHRALGITQKSAWFMLHRIREAMKNESVMKMGGSEGGPVEVDEAYVGGQPKNRHLGKRDPVHGKKYLLDEDGERSGLNPDYVPHVCGRAAKKTAVFGMLDREARQVRAHVIPEMKREVLMEASLGNVEKGSTIYSDGLRDYQPLRNMEFVHETVNHVNEYVRGQIHTQGIEDFWSLLKRGPRGTYVAVEPFHLERYIGEQVFRYNNRATKDNPLTDEDRFALAMHQAVGRRLTYAQLRGQGAD